MKCPKCGHIFKAENQAKGGKARWRGMTKGQRRKAASDAAKARWARRQNDKAQRRLGQRRHENKRDATPAVR